MAVRFTTFKFTNGSGLRVSVKLEAPVGTKVADYSVASDSTQTFAPGVDDAQSARVSVNDGTHATTQEVSVAGRPYSSFIEALTSVYNVGSIRGEVSARY